MYNIIIFLSTIVNRRSHSKSLFKSIFCCFSTSIHRNHANKASNSQTAKTKKNSFIKSNSFDSQLNNNNNNNNIIDDSLMRSFQIQPQQQIITVNKLQTTKQPQRQSYQPTIITPADSPYQQIAPSPLSNNNNMIINRRKTIKTTTRLLPVNVTALRLVPIQGEKKLMQTRRNLNNNNKSINLSPIKPTQPTPLKQQQQSTMLNLMPITFTAYPSGNSTNSNSNKKISFSIISQSTTQSQSVLSSINNATLMALLNSIQNGNKPSPPPPQPQPQPIKSESSINYSDLLDIGDDWPIINNNNNNNQIPVQEINNYDLFVNNSNNLVDYIATLLH